MREAAISVGEIKNGQRIELINEQMVVEIIMNTSNIDTELSQLSWTINFLINICK